MCVYHIIMMIGDATLAPRDYLLILNIYLFMWIFIINYYDELINESKNIRGTSFM